MCVCVCVCAESATLPEERKIPKQPQTGNIGYLIFRGRPHKICLWENLAGNWERVLAFPGVTASSAE